MLSLRTDLFPGFSRFHQIDSNDTSISFSAVHDKTGQSVFIKTFFKSSIITPAKQKYFQQEISTLESIDHPFLSQYFMLIPDYEAYYIVTEYSPNGTLFEYLNDHGKLRECDFQRILCQIASAIKLLHSKDIVNRNLNLNNIVLDQQLNSLIIDFGWSAHLENSHDLLKTQCGMIPFLAPEIIKHKRYSKPVDIWSLGIICYAMILGTLPWYDTNIINLTTKIEKAPVEFPSNFPLQLKDLISSMLEKDPDMRITIEQIANHPYVLNCRYSFYLKDDFIFSKKYSVVPTAEKDIDFNVIQVMIKSGINCERAVRSLLEKEQTEDTMIYKIIRKKQVEATLHSSNEIREMFKMRRQEAQSTRSEKVVLQNHRPIGKADVASMRTEKKNLQRIAAHVINYASPVKPNIVTFT